MTEVKMKEILSHPDKLINDTKSSVLSTIFRKLLVLENVTPDKFQRLMQLWTQNSKSSVPPGHRRSQARGNIEKELAYSNMSWSVLVKGLRFLAFTKIEIRITAFNDKLKKKVTTSVAFSLPDNYDDIDLMRGGLIANDETTTDSESSESLQTEVSSEPSETPPNTRWWEQTHTK